MSTISPRRGKFIEVPKYKTKAPAAVRQAMEASLSVHGARMFNILPQYIRDCDVESVDQFKHALDDWLSKVPDQPTIPGRQRPARINSLIDQAAYAADKAI